MRATSGSASRRSVLPDADVQRAALPVSGPRAPRRASYLERGHDRIVATTYAMIEAMDSGIGQVLESLDRHGLADDTLVMFTSDNGPAFFNPPFMLGPGESTFNERFNAGLRGSKGWVYEGGIRVPMILRHPERLPANAANRDPRPFHRLAADPGLDVRGRTGRRQRNWTAMISAASSRARPPGVRRDVSGSGTSTIRASRPMPPSGMATGSWSGR